MTASPSLSSARAPVCLFAFCRPNHTARTLAALAASPLAAQTELYAFVDGPRGPEDAEAVAAVIALISAQTGFAAVHLRARDENAGLARSIIEGVSAVMEAHGRAIVVEDDIVTSPAFLSYMNHALDLYADTPEVWHIAGYAEPWPKGTPPRGASFLRCMSCWGWASWADRWAHFEKDPEGLIARFSPDDIDRFNLDGAQDFWGQITANASGKLNTWAIFWYATIFENGGLCLSPHHSYVENIGLDGSGTHCGDDLAAARDALNPDAVPPLPDPAIAPLIEDAEALEQLRQHHTRKPGPVEKLGREWRRLGRQIRSLLPS